MKIFLSFIITIFTCKSIAQIGKSISIEKSLNEKNLVVYTTADSTNFRMSITDTLKFSGQTFLLESKMYVFVDPEKSFQTFVGIGGAITDAAAETFSKLPLKKQHELLIAYYDKKNGIGYSLARTNMNSCDFSSDSYTYVNDSDINLKSFNIEHDKKYKIPLIKKAIVASGGKLLLFSSPWSPPAYMKDNHDMLNGGKLLPKYYKSWASYFTKFIKAYQNEGIPVWGITIQNEPMAKQHWESCIYTAEEEKNFLKNFLGPIMKQEGLGKTKIIVWDHNRDLIYPRAEIYLNDPEAAKYIWGIGFHWYETWSGGHPMFENVKKVQESFPDKKLIFTEGCAERFDSTKYGDWSLGEKYAYNMIHDFNNGIVGFTDWNILLDETGGPNHLGNFCFAPVHGNTKTGELIYTNAYFYIGHFSKFIQRGAKRISCSSSRSQIIATAFKNPDGKIDVIVLNQSDQKVLYNLWIKDFATEIKILPHSIQTLVF